MDHTRLGKKGPKISVIGLGAWQADNVSWGKEVNEKDSIEAIKRSLELGVNFVDTAELYGRGHSEEIVGRAIKGFNRDEIVVASKVSGKHLRYQDVMRACKGSLGRLGLKKIDVYQVHWPDPWEQVHMRHTIKAMEDLYKQGKIGAVGVSNFAVRDLKEARSLLSSTDIVSNQVRCNILQQEVKEEVLHYCRKEGISVIAWSPLAQGVLTGKYTVKKKPIDEVRSENKLFKDSNLRQASKIVAVLRDIAASRNKAISQVALNWLITQLTVIPIPGAKDSKQAEQNAGAAGWKLATKEAGQIAEVANKIQIDYF
jgi:myo-inositol catabolism protein IolS